jgi:hypothetical protein
MDSILPIITMSDLQRSAKDCLQKLDDYAVIRKHGKDMAFVLHPRLGKVLLESGMLEVLKRKVQETSVPAAQATSADAAAPSDASLTELDRVLGQVLRELSRR